MEKINVLGTGHAMTTACWNTCFTLENNQGEHLLVDTGGGVKTITQLAKMNININDIHHLFITHKHTDHLLGLFWYIRVIDGALRKKQYQGNLNIYLHDELYQDVSTMLEIMLPKIVEQWFGTRIFLHTVENGQVVQIYNYDIKFLDIYAKKDKQFGFKTSLENGKTLIFLGDETFDEQIIAEAKNADYLIHEAFCVDAEADIFKPYQKAHATVKTAAELATRLQVKNLIIWHSEDSDMANRKTKYLTEAAQYFTGKTYAPVDLDIIELL